MPTKFRFFAAAANARREVAAALAVVELSASILDPILDEGESLSVSTGSGIGDDGKPTEQDFVQLWKYQPTIPVQF